MGTVKIENFRPRVDRVIVEKLQGADKTKTGLIIPDTARNKEPIQRGKIISFGPQVTDLGKGDQVGFMLGAGSEFIFDKGEEAEYLILREKDLLVVIDENE